MGPKPTPNRALSLTRTEKTELATTLELLTRLYVRNLNQHRRSHWFSSLVAFRKQLGLLLGEIEAATEGIKSLKGKKAQEAKEERERKVTERLGFWDEVCHGWYLTFTQLLAAGQFAVLGLVLMAAVARVCKLVGITEFYQDFASEDMKEVLQVMEKGEAVRAFGEAGAEADAEGVAQAGDEGEDFGEVIERTQFGDEGLEF